MNISIQLGIILNRDLDEMHKIGQKSIGNPEIIVEIKKLLWKSAFCKKSFRNQQEI